VPWNVIITELEKRTVGRIKVSYHKAKKILGADGWGFPHPLGEKNSIIVPPKGKEHFVGYIITDIVTQDMTNQARPIRTKLAQFTQAGAEYAIDFIIKFESQ
jgi:hypothetical protein